MEWPLDGVRAQAHKKAHKKFEIYRSKDCITHLGAKMFHWLKLKERGCALQSQRIRAIANQCTFFVLLRNLVQCQFS